MLAPKYFLDYLKNKVMKINILYSWLSLSGYWLREGKHQRTNTGCDNQNFFPDAGQSNVPYFYRVATLLRNLRESPCLQDSIQTDIQSHYDLGLHSLIQKS